MSVIVIEFVTMDGILTDPDGTEGTPGGGWMFRHGPEVISGDPFQLGGMPGEWVLLLGRKTWEHFAEIWPGRDDPFSALMNEVPKLVASRTLTDASGWANSTVVDGAVTDAVKQEARDIVVMGSPSVVRALAAADLIDEYRLMTFPTVLGAGERVFPAGGSPAYFECESARQAGPTVLSTYRRSTR
jgi:dihydrofolate reductase